MGHLNGIPIKWGEGDDQLLGSLFPEPSQMLQDNVGDNQVLDAYESGLQESLFYPSKIYADDDLPPPDNKTRYYSIFLGFDSRDALEKYYAGLSTFRFSFRERIINPTADEFLKGNPYHIICCYLKVSSSQSDKLLLLRMGENPIAAYSASADYVSNATIVSRELSRNGENKEGFAYSLQDMEQAFRSAIPDKRDVPDEKRKTGRSKLYHDNYDMLKALVGGKSVDAQTENAMRQLCDTLSKIKYDVLQSYNRQNDVRYNTVWGRRDNLTVNDILSMNRRLLKMAAQVEKFRNAEFKTPDELMYFINHYLLDISSEGAVTDHVIIYPFTTLSAEKRKQLLLLLLNGDKLEFSGRIKATKGLVVYLLLATARDEERLSIIMELNEGGKIFDLMNTNGDNDFLFSTVYLVAATIKNATDEMQQTEWFKSAVINGNFIFYNHDHASAYKAGILSGDKKLFLANKTRIDLSPEGIFQKVAEKIGEEIAGVFNKAPDLPEKSTEQVLYEKLYVSPKTAFDPLELIAFRAETNVKSGVLTMEEGDLVLLPACLVYLLFKEREIAEDNFKFISTLTLLLLPIGIAGLVAAIEAASVWGIIITATDIVVDGTVLVANVPDVQKNDPEFTKAVNTFAFFYGLMRLSVGSSKNGSTRNNKNIDKKLQAAIKVTNKFGKNVFLGSGGKLKYLNVLSRKMYGQQEPMSCLAACIRQLAKDKKILMSEDSVRELAGTWKGGTPIGDNVVDALNKIFEKEFKGGFLNFPGTPEQAAKILSDKGPWIAITREQFSPHHAVIVDKIANGKVYIRDPYPLEGIEGIKSKNPGVKATVKLTDFIEFWRRGGYGGYYQK